MAMDEYDWINWPRFYAPHKDRCRLFQDAEGEKEGAEKTEERAL